MGVSLCSLGNKKWVSLGPMQQSKVEKRKIKET